MVDHLRRALLFWRGHAVRIKRLRLQADRSVVERDDQLLAATFERWRGHRAERRLWQVEQEVALRHEDAIMFSVWDAWKAKSTVRGT